MRVVDFYDKIAEIFNCPHFVPETQILPDLHPNHFTSIKLNLGEYRCTREKVKDFMVWVRPRLAKIVSKCELNGAGAGQMSLEDEDDYGHFYITRCEAGDDRAIFLKMRPRRFSYTGGIAWMRKDLSILHYVFWTNSSVRTQNILRWLVISILTQ